MTKPRYTKPSKTFDEQVAQLQERGMGGDPAVIKNRLQSTNYYRLSGYFYFFRVFQGDQRHRGEQFRDGLQFEQVWNLYLFDCSLRTLVLQAIEKIEVAVRTQVSYHHALKFSPHAYAEDPASLPNLGTRRRDGVIVSRRDEFLDDLRKCVRRSHEQFVGHFYENYSDSFPPIWMATELLTLGSVLHILEGSPVDVKKAIAGYFDVPWVILESWLLHLNTVRNVCAHHGRFWNRRLGNVPRIPPEKTYGYWHRPVEIFSATADGGRWPTTFATLSICNHMLTRVYPGSGWAKRFKALLDANPKVSRPGMGIPEHWTSSPVWHDVD